MILMNKLDPDENWIDMTDKELQMEKTSSYIAGVVAGCLSSLLTGVIIFTIMLAFEPEMVYGMAIWILEHGPK